MHRRSLLTAFATGAAALAGCLQGPLDTAGGGTSDAPTDRWGPEPPCPTFDTTIDRTVCTGGGHAEPSSVTVALQPPLDAPVRAGKPFAVTLHPRADVPLTFPPDDWTIHRFAGDRWTEVAGGDTADGFTTVYPDEQYAWRIGRDGPATTTDDAADVGVSLYPGRYAFSVTASVGRGWTHGERVECVALFAIR